MKDDEKQRTLQQNRALHKYFALLARTLNERGLDMRTVLKEEIEILWTTEMVKDYLWRPIMQIMEGKVSTTEMNTTDPSAVYEVLSRHMAQKHGVDVPFPSNQPPMIGGKK
jgi:hypothetical protein